MLPAVAPALYDGACTEVRIPSQTRGNAWILPIPVHCWGHRGLNGALGDRGTDAGPVGTIRAAISTADQEFEGRVCR